MQAASRGRAAAPLKGASHNGGLDPPPAGGGRGGGGGGGAGGRKRPGPRVTGPARALTVAAGGGHGMTHEAVEIAGLPARRRVQVMAYGGLILLLLQFAAPYEGLIGLPITFFLKNKLHLGANAIAQFNVMTA